MPSLRKSPAAIRKDFVSRASREMDSNEESHLNRFEQDLGSITGKNGFVKYVDLNLLRREYAGRASSAAAKGNAKEAALYTKLAIVADAVKKQMIAEAAEK